MDPLGEASIAVKVNKLRTLKCLKVKVGMERDPNSRNGSQDLVKNNSLEESHRQFHVPVMNNSVSEDRTDSASTSSFHKNNNLNSSSENGRKEWYNSDVENTSRQSSLVNGELPHVHIVPDENTVNRPIHSPVPGMVEQNNTAYRTSMESQDSQSAVLQNSSHHQLVEIEDAREACVSKTVS